MQRCVALLRGINVGGKMLVTMADLRELCVELGFETPRTLLNSGNVVFGGNGSVAAIEKKLEQAVRVRSGHALHVLVRAAKQWRAMIDANPFPGEAETDPSHLVAICLREAPSAKTVDVLRAAIVGRETVHCIGGVLYAYYPDKMGQSKLTLQLIERKLATIGTARNWNTVLKIAAAIDSA